MALTNLESLVLRLVAGVSNVGTNPVRTGMDQGAAKTPANSSLSDPPSYRGHLLRSRLQRMDDADVRAGRSDGFQGRFLPSRGLASSAQGSVLSGQSLTAEPARFTGEWRALAAISAGKRCHRGRPVAHTLSIAPAIGNPRAKQARSEPAAGAFTASTRGERKR